MEAQAVTGKGFFSGVAEQYTYFNTLQIEGQNVANLGNQYVHSSISQIYAGYNFSERFGLQFNLPVIYREYGFFENRGNDLGLGDAALVGNFRIYQYLDEDLSLRCTALAGVKFPTGDSAHLNPGDEDFAPGIGNHDLALGSGSFDGLIGAGFFARWKRLFVTGAAQYAIRSEGDFGYQYANDWTWVGGPGVFLGMSQKYTLGLQAVVSGESKGEDTVHGVATDDTATTSVYLGPQISLTWSSRFSAQLGVDLPVSIESTGQQLVPTYRVRCAFSMRF